MKLHWGQGLSLWPATHFFGLVQVIWDGQKNNHFGPFYTILGNFGWALLFKKTGDFEILSPWLRLLNITNYVYRLQVTFLNMFAFCFHYILIFKFKEYFGLTLALQGTQPADWHLTNNFWKLRGKCTPTKWACFVCYLKIINTPLKNNDSLEAIC